MVTPMIPGIYPDMTPQQYYADPCPVPSLTQSLAKVLLDQSAKHAWLQHPRLGQKHRPVEAYKKETAIGNAAHKLMIGRGRHVCIIGAPDFRTDEAKKARDNAYLAGHIPILDKHYRVAQTMVKVARQQLDECGCPGAFTAGTGEVALVCQEGDIWMRTLVDWMCGQDLLYDYKTSGRSAHPQSIAHTMVDAGWDIQAAMQECILDTLHTPGKRRRFRFVMQENEAPYELTVSELPESTMHKGREKLQLAIHMWRQCVKSGQYPGYPRAINYPEYPVYAERAWIDRKVADEVREFDPEVVNAG